jgi:N-acetylmuramoyl-L-alanine amidase
MKPALLCLLAALMVLPATEVYAQSAKALYERALARERELRDGKTKPTLQQWRAAVTAYERIVRRFPTSAYSDNALWQGGNLALLAFDDYAQAADRKTGIRLLSLLRSEYPSSSLRTRAAAIVNEREAVPVPAAPAPVSAPETDSEAPGRSAPVAIRDVKKSELPDGTRVTIEMDAEVVYHSERIDNPKRVFFDLKNTRPGAALQDATLKFDDALVREVRLGRHPNATRVVMDMEGAESYSVFTLYDPFRIVVDFKRSAVNAPQPLPAARTEVPAPDPAATTPTPPKAVATAPKPSPAQQADSPAPAESVPVPTTSAPAGPPPVPPSANMDGKFSLSRQLGLGVARVVIDAGHGGRDPGAKANGVTEAELTLDVATRLKKLLDKQPGIEVVMTRSTDVFIPLEERTRIANREGADLFLSIHANASRNVRARGVETYFLNFATNSEAEAVAARENAGSGQTMHKLPEIVRAIATNNKIDESRDFAEIVQRAMVRRLSQRNKALRDIGVKQAPFVVLIGAEMPSVLAEMSFVTNKQDASLLKTGAYRQQIAEALLDAVLRYQQSLKKMRAVGTAQTSSR